MSTTPAALAQPKPDPAPVPTPAPAPQPEPPASAPAAETTPTTGSYRQPEPRPNRETKRAAQQRERRERASRQTDTAPMHRPRVEAGATMAAARQLPASVPPVAPVDTGASAEAGRFPAVEVGFLLFLGAALLGLALATIPASVLSGISVRLVDRRQDIGLILAGISASAAIFVIFVAT